MENRQAQNAHVIALVLGRLKAELQAAQRLAREILEHRDYADKISAPVYLVTRFRLEHDTIPMLEKLIRDIEHSEGDALAVERWSLEHPGEELTS